MKRRIRNIDTCFCLFPQGAFLLSSRLDSAVKCCSIEVLKLYKEYSSDNKYIHDSGWGLELKSGLGQGKFAVSHVQRLLCCSPVLEDTSF